MKTKLHFSVFFSWILFAVFSLSAPFLHASESGDIGNLRVPRISSIQLQALQGKAAVSAPRTYAQAVVPSANKTYVFHGEGNLVLSCDESGSALLMETYQKENSQQIWKLNGVSDHFFAITNEAFKYKAIDFSLEGFPDTQPLLWNTNTENPNQRLQFEKVPGSDNQYYIFAYQRLTHEKFYLGVKAAGQIQSVPAQGSNEKPYAFTFEEVKSTTPEPTPLPEPSREISEQGVYLIAHHLSGKAISNLGNLEDDAPILLSTIDANSQAQMWNPRATGNKDEYAFQNPTSMKAIDMAPSLGHLVQWSFSSTNPNQRFKVIPVPGKSGFFQLVSDNGYRRQYLANSGDQLSMQSFLDGEETYFRFYCLGDINTIPRDKNYYVLHNKHTRRVLGFENNQISEPLSVLDFKQGDFRQIWKLRAVGKGFILSNNSLQKYAMQILANSPKTRLVLGKMNGDDAKQIFNYESIVTDPGAYRIFTKINNKKYYLCVGQNNLVQLTDDAAEPTTAFVFEKVDPVGAPYWENETIFGENKEVGHTTFIPYTSTELMTADAAYGKPWLTPEKADYLTLNGIWKFKLSDNPGERPEAKDFYGDQADVSAWDTISVPSCWEMKGYDRPLYYNQEYAFFDDPPYIESRIADTGAAENPVGSYRRNFNLPEGWDSKNVFLHFDGLYSAALVWVNGKYVGYTQGGNNDAEFDVTSCVRTGKNNICVQVIRWCDGSYLEGQDMFRMSGLHRDVYLYATPHTFVRDHYITSQLNANDGYRSGSMKVQLEMDNRLKLAAGKKVVVRLIDPKGKTVQEQSADFSFAQGDSVKQATLAFNNLKQLQLWSAENPVLYTVEVIQQEGDRDEMVFSTKYGFRNIEKKDGLIYINGERVYFKGVNTQDTHPYYGRSIDVPTMLKDISMMKQANVNTVRTSHYPRQAKMYAMFDYYGLYIMDEADVECHRNWRDNGAWGCISNQPSWKGQYVDRITRMVRRDRNHPSVIFWSLGNESGVGCNFTAAFEATKQLDPRPIHYHGTTYEGLTDCSELHSEMYPGLGTVAASSSSNKGNQPYFICEYAHAMGNAVGNLKEYWDIIEGSKLGIGGCIWDWVDQSFIHPQSIKSGNVLKNGFPHYTSGYDYAGGQMDNFVNNGIISPDRAWTPELTEVKKVYQYAQITYDPAGKVSLKNKYNFTNLNTFNLKYTLLEDGTAVETHTKRISPVLPGQEAQISVPLTTEMQAGREYLLHVALVTRQATDWCEAGYAMATEQFVLQERPQSLPLVDNVTQGLKVTNNKNLIVESANVYFEISPTGEIQKWNSHGVDLITSARQSPAASNVRWVENERGNFGETANYPTGQMTKYFLSDDAQRCYVSVTTQRNNCTYNFTYTVYAGGEVDLEVNYQSQNEGLRRLGFDMIFPKGFENVEYYAKGPWENYVDRQTGSYLGRYTSTVDDFFEMYAHPQSMGNRTALRDLELSNPETGEFIKVTTEGPVSFSLLHFDQKDFLTPQLHPWDLKKHAEVFATFDFMQRGLGNGSCGPDAERKYWCPTGSHSHKIRFNAGRRVPSVIGEATVGQCRISYDRSSENVVCTGRMAQDTEVRVYNLGGVLVSRTLWQTGQAQLALSLKGQPRGAYLVVFGNGQRTHKLMKF